MNYLNVTLGALGGGCGLSGFDSPNTRSPNGFNYGPSFIAHSKFKSNHGFDADLSLDTTNYETTPTQ